MPSDWTRGLSKQQLAVIQQDTRDFERRHPEQRQDHVHRDIAAELSHRERESEKYRNSKES